MRRTDKTALEQEQDDACRSAQAAWERAGCGNKPVMLGITSLAGILLCQQRADGQVRLEQIDQSVGQGDAIFCQRFSWQRNGQRREFLFCGTSLEKLGHHPDLEKLGVTKILLALT